MNSTQLNIIKNTLYQNSKNNSCYHKTNIHLEYGKTYIFFNANLSINENIEKSQYYHQTFVGKVIETQGNNPQIGKIEIIQSYYDYQGSSLKYQHPEKYDKIILSELENKKLAYFNNYINIDNL